MLGPGRPQASGPQCKNDHLSPGWTTQMPHFSKPTLGPEPPWKLDTASARQPTLARHLGHEPGQEGSRQALPTLSPGCLWKHRTVGLSGRGKIMPREAASARPYYYKSRGDPPSRWKSFLITCFWPRSLFLIFAETIAHQRVWSVICQIHHAGPRRPGHRHGRPGVDGPPARPPIAVSGEIYEPNPDSLLLGPRPEAPSAEAWLHPPHFSPLLSPALPLLGLWT